MSVEYTYLIFENWAEYEYGQVCPACCPPPKSSMHSSSFLLGQPKPFPPFSPTLAYQGVNLYSKCDSIFSPLLICAFRSSKKVHSLLVNKVTCRENKVGEKGGRGFGCLSKKEEECMLLFGGGQQAGQT